MKPGIGIHQMTMEEYLALDALSSGRLHTLLTRSPYHAKHDSGGEPSSESDMGIAIHDALLEGVDRIVAVDAQDWKKAASRELRDEIRSQGKLPLLAHNVPKVTAAVNAALEHVANSELRGIFMRGKAEQTIVWQEGDDGETLMKARPDLLTDAHDLILHVKTTAGSAEPSSWIRNQLCANGYDLAVIFYEWGLKAIHELADPRSVFLIIEQSPPHGCSLVALSPAMYDLAWRKAERATRTWQDCHATGKWPKYPTAIHYAEPYPWQLAEAEEINVEETLLALQRNEAQQKQQPDYGSQP